MRLIEYILCKHLLKTLTPTKPAIKQYAREPNAVTKAITKKKI